MPVLSLSLARPLLVGSAVVLLAGVAAAAVTPQDASDAVSTGGSAESAAREATAFATTSTTSTTTTSTTSTTVLPPAVVAETIPATTEPPTTAPPATEPPATAPPTTEPPPAATTLPPLQPGYARLTISNSYGRAVHIRIEDVAINEFDLAPGAATETFDIPVAPDHADSANVTPVGEQCGTGGVGNNFMDGHTYVITATAWDGTGDVEGGYCTDGTAPGLRARDETCGNSFWVGNFGRTPPLCRTG